MNSLITVSVEHNTLRVDIDLLQLRTLAFRVALRMLRTVRR